MPLLQSKTALATVLCAVVCSQSGLAQTPPATILVVDYENQVRYVYDASDPSKFATTPNVTTQTTPTNFYHQVTVADIVAVNNQPAKGVFVLREQLLILRPNPTPGQAIADVVVGSAAVVTWQILQPDGTQVGTIMGEGFSGNTTPRAPGAPLAVTASNIAIVGGTGAFLGARGLSGQGMAFAAPRGASITEDPSNRRNTTGGRAQSVIYLIPMERPEILVASTGPAVFHADFTPVTAAKPAKTGEVLVVRASGLGPTVPGIDPSRPFPQDPLQPVNSPVAVSVNGKQADLINAVGWPGQVDTYRVDFRVPDGTAPGTAAIQLSAAWIQGPSVNISIQ